MKRTPMIFPLEVTVVAVTGALCLWATPVLGQPRQHPVSGAHPEPRWGPASDSVQLVTDTSADRRFRSEHVVMGIDCYGLDPAVSCERLGATIGLRRGQKKSVGWSNKSAIERLRTVNGYALINVSPIFSPDGSAYVNIDVVEPEERDRLEVRDSPDQQIAVHSNLLELYAAFDREWMGLFSKGIAPVATTSLGFWTYRQPALAAFVELFRREVPKYRDELVAVAMHDEEPTRRRAAAGLLSYAAIDETTNNALSLAMLDPDASVRSAAARALVPRVRHASSQGHTLVPVGPVLQMLGLPSASDRSRAATLLVEMAKVPELRQPILSGGLPVLLQMLAASWPTASRQAAAVLEEATGLTYGTDVDRWSDALKAGL